MLDQTELHSSTSLDLLSLKATLSARISPFSENDPKCRCTGSIIVLLWGPCFNDEVLLTLSHRRTKQPHVCFAHVWFRTYFSTELAVHWRKGNPLTLLVKKNSFYKQFHNTKLSELLRLYNWSMSKSSLKFWSNLADLDRSRPKKNPGIFTLPRGSTNADGRILVMGKTWSLGPGIEALEFRFFGTCGWVFGAETLKNMLRRG